MKNVNAISFQPDSSAVKVAAYAPGNKMLYMEFTTTEGGYHYTNVPHHVFMGLLNAESKGRFVNTYIKGRFSFDRGDSIAND